MDNLINETPNPIIPTNLDLNNLTTEQKVELLKLLDAKKLSDSDRMLQDFDPSLIQDAYICCMAKIALLIGANRSGKSEVGAVDTLISATGIVPDKLKEHYPAEKIRLNTIPKNQIYWVSSLDFPSSRDITQAKITKFCPKRMYNGFNKEDKKLFLKTENVIGFKSADSGREKYQGVSCPHFWGDEEHPEDIYDESYMRTTDCSGRLRLTFTPVEGLTWAYQKLYKKAKYYYHTVNIHGIPEEVGYVHKQDEIHLLKERKLVVVPNTDPDADEDIVVFQMSIYDNKYLPDAEIWRAEKKYKEDPAQYNARILGRFTKLTGRNVFDIATLLKMQGQVATKFHQGEIVNGQFKKGSRGRLVIFTEKIKKDNGVYVIGADVAEGLEEGDYSSACVLDRRTCEEVARWHGHVSPDEFASILYDIGTFYNKAYLAPERNFHGYGVVAALREKRYLRLYYDKDRAQEVIRNSSTGRKTYGWETNAKTKPIMIQTLANYIREKHIKINDINTIDELITYVYGKDGQTGAMGGCFDDRVVSLAIALQLYELTPIHDINNSGGIYHAPNPNPTTGY